jgi:hypothetical protein
MAAPVRHTDEVFEVIKKHCIPQFPFLFQNKPDSDGPWMAAIFQRTSR